MCPSGFLGKARGAMFKFLDKKRKDAKYKKAGAAHTLGSEKTVTPAPNASTPQPHGRPKTARSDAECAAAAAALALKVPFQPVVLLITSNNNK